MKLIMILFPAILFIGCMHAGMSMMGGGAQPPADPILQKEVISAGIKAIATFPPMQQGEDALLTLRLFDLHSDRPISGAAVYFHAQYLQPMDSSGNDIAVEHATRTHTTDIARDVPEGNEPGSYSVRYGSSQSGEQDLMFHVTSIKGRNLEPELVIDAKRMITGPPAHEHAGMTGGSGSPNVFIMIGGLMAVGMVAFMLFRGGMF